MLGVRRAGIALLVGVVGVGAVDTISNHDNTKDTSPDAAVVHFTDKSTNSSIRATEDEDVVISHTPEKYYGASVEEHFTAKGPPRLDGYPIGPGTFVTKDK